MVSVSDNCASLSASDVVITQVTSDEPEDVKGGGDGKTNNDIVIAGTCGSVDVRRERQGGGNGRVYTSHLSVDDGSGNTDTAICLITVPHDQSGAPAMDDGPAYGVSCGASKQGLDELSVATDVPSEYVLEGNYPNPFNPETTIRFSVPESAQVRLVVHDVLGRQVRVLVDGTRVAGTHEVVFDASDLPSGTYLVRLTTPQGSFVQMMQLVK